MGRRSGGGRSANCRSGICPTSIPAATAWSSRATSTRAQAEAKAFRAQYEGKLAALSGAELGAAIAQYETLQERLGRVMSYAGLVHSGDMSDPEIGRFYQTMHERVNAIETELLFFTLELNRIDDEVLDEKLAAPELAHYAPWLRDVRAFRPHQLADELESSCTRSRSPGAPPGSGCSTRPKRRCAFGWAARSSPAPRP